jgi:uncharacterized Fe-S radical SAM superfamily protein PflX
VTREWATAMRGRGDIPFEVHGGGRFLLPAREYVPAYVRTYEEGLLRVKVEEALEALRCCTLCPRTCRVNRLENRFAVCKVGRYARVSAAFHHFGEEDVLRGWRGSGTIFFAWCNLRCQFCLHPDTRVFTDRGARRIEEVFASAPPGVVVGGGIVRPVSGERVLTRTGRMAPVAKAFCHPYRGEMVVITPRGLPDLVVTPDHSLFVASRPCGPVEKVPARLVTTSHALVGVGKGGLQAAHLVAQSAGVGGTGRGSLEGAPGGPEAARRTARPKERDGGLRVPVERVSRLWYEGPVYNLEVADEDHSYVAEGVAVGNCQNFETSQIGEGVDVTAAELARIMLRLQEEGCHNINLVTPEHVVPQILEALLLAVQGGLRIPIVYNTSAYDSLHSLRLMDGVVDVYMPDFKLWDRERSRRYLLAPEYPEAARQAIRAMHDQVGPLRVTEDGLAVRGVLVRHLVMPGMLDETREIMGFLAGLSRDTYVNIMDQYYPAWKATTPAFREINRRISPQELEEAFALARAAGLWRFDRRWRRLTRMVG